LLVNGFDNLRERKQQKVIWQTINRIFGTIYERLAPALPVLCMAGGALIQHEGVAAMNASTGDQNTNAPITDAQPAQPPEGRMMDFEFTASRIFPGTVRHVWVFVPAQYDGSRPACVQVATDGFREHEKKFMESLIAAGEMPVTVGVFVTPGNLPAPMPARSGGATAASSTMVWATPRPGFSTRNCCPMSPKPAI
jgi:hypothetical protein